MPGNAKHGTPPMTEPTRIDIAYGAGQLPVTLPASAEPTIIRKPGIAKLKAPHAAVRDALASPIGAERLAEAARGKRTACILICDITRPVPNHLFLRPMIDELTGAGLALDDICVLVATGLHRPNEGEELERLVGDDWVLANVRVENHFARDAAAHVDLGVTEGRGVPVKLDRRFVEADIRIATGLVEPHFMAGWSGGRKVIAPGVAHEDTIRTFHSARFMEDPHAIQCNLTSNPLHEAQLEIVRMIGGPIWALNTVIDEDRDLVFVSFGDVVESHAAAVDFVRPAAVIPVGRKFKTVVTSSAGHPLDRTYYQTVKGMVTPIDILEPGGTLIIAATCSEGFGSAEFRAAQDKLVALGPTAFLDTIMEKRFADIDEWQTEMQLKPMRIGKICLYTEGLDAAERVATGVDIVDDMDAAIADAVSRAGDPAVAVIPEGPYVVPVVGA